MCSKGWVVRKESKGEVLYQVYVALKSILVKNKKHKIVLPPKSSSVAWLLLVLQNPFHEYEHTQCP